jgi:hypothetical protein
MLSGMPFQWIFVSKVVLADKEGVGPLRIVPAWLSDERAVDAFGVTAG